VIRVGTRRSALALAQADLVAQGLRTQGYAVELVPMRTEGDRLAGAPLALLGGKGLFVREIEQALLRGTIDVAVHSLKDLPAAMPPGLCLGAFPRREDPRDVLLTRTGRSLDDLAPGSVVGTSSPRRRALVLAARPDLVVEPLRGNVDTRMIKLESGACDAIILAAAGLHRLGVVPPHGVALDPEEFIPAIGQGIIAIEARADDRETLAALAALDEPQTRDCAEAERAFLARLGASCNSPLAAHATVLGAAPGTLRLSALIASEDGRDIIRAHADGVRERARALGDELAENMLARGAAGLAGLRAVPDGAA
jgi:hydroxymethylbilane synthase